MAGKKQFDGTMLSRMGLTFDRSQIARSIAGMWGLPVFDDMLGPARSRPFRDPMVEELLTGADFDRRTVAADALAMRLGSIRDSQVLREIASRTTSQMVMREALDLIGGDIASLAYVFDNTTCEQTVEEAMARLCRDIGSIEDAGLLKRMAVKARYIPHRSAIADRLGLMMSSLDDTHCLRIIFAYGTRTEDKPLVISKLASMVESIAEDSMALRMIAVYSPDEAGRSRALERMDGRFQSIAAVASISNHHDTRMQAVGMLSGRSESLVRVAVNGSYKDAMDAAVDALEDDLPSLKEVAKRSLNLDVRSRAIRKVTELMSSVHDATSLRFIIMDADDERTQAVAADKLAGMVERLTNRYDLIYVAMLSNDRKARARATGMLADDHDALTVIGSHSKHDDSRNRASELLRELETRP